jgi:L-rhamnose isomerase
MSDQFFLNAAAKAKAFNCTTYICGHFHPQQIVDKKVDGIRILILPKGRTEIEL